MSDKIDTSEIDLIRKKGRLEQLVAVENLQDIYDLDSKIICMRDFLKSLEVSNHRLSIIVDDVALLEQHQGLFDFSEGIYDRLSEVRLCQYRATRLIS